MADFKHIIRNFSGGLLEDKRQESPSHFSITKHFDTFTYPMKLVPYSQTIAALATGGGSVTGYGIIKFLYAQHLSATIFRLYGFGVNGSGNAKVYTFDIDAGTANTTQWVAATNGESASGAPCPDVFFYYKGFMYMYKGGNTIVRYDTTEVAAFNENYQTISYTTNAARPVRHTHDDTAYFFDDNNVYSLFGTTWNGAVLTLSTNERIVCALPFGTYLAIATVTVGNLDVHSTVYLWDRDSTLATLTDIIDFGAGKLVHLACIDDRLIGIMSYYVDNLYALNKGKVLIKMATSSTATFAETVDEITTDTVSVIMPRTDYVKNEKLYFPMTAQLNGDMRSGIWAVDSSGKAALDFIEPLATSYQGIFSTADLWWIAHSANGSVTHTDATGAYSTTNPSVYETLILSTVSVTNRGTIIMNNATEKKLIGVTVMCEPLPSGGQIVMKYRTDNNVSWTTIFTYTNATIPYNSGMSHSAVNIESTGANLGTYNEIQFRIESSGGAVINGMSYGGEVISNDLY